MSWEIPQSNPLASRRLFLMVNVSSRGSFLRVLKKPLVFSEAFVFVSSRDDFSLAASPSGKKVNKELMVLTIIHVLFLKSIKHYKAKTIQITTVM